MTYSTYACTADGKVHDLAVSHPPHHDHPGHQTCAACLVVNAWTAPVTEAR